VSTGGFADGAAARASERAAWNQQLLILWTAQCASIAGSTLVFPFLPLMVKTVGVQDPPAVALWSGAMVAITQVALGMFAPLWGRLADRLGRKPMLVRSMIGAAITYVGTGLAPNVYVLFAMRFASGALAGTIMANTALVASIAPRERVASSIGAISSANYVGTTLGPGVGAILVPVVGIRPAFAIAGAIPLLAAAAVQVGVRESFVRPDRQARPARARTALREVRMGGVVVTLAVSALLAQSVGSGLAPTLPLRVASLVDTHVGAFVGAAFALQAGCAAIGALVVSRIARGMRYSTIIILAALWAGLFFGLIGAASSVGLLIAFAGLGGLAGGMLMPAVNTLLGRVSPAAVRAEVFGLSASAMAVGGTVSPLASTALVAGYGTAAPFAMVAALELSLAVWIASRFRLRPRPGG